MKLETFLKETESYSWDSNPGMFDSKACYLSTMLPQEEKKIPNIFVVEGKEENSLHPQPKFKTSFESLTAVVIRKIQTLKSPFKAKRSK